MALKKRAERYAIRSQPQRTAPAITFEVIEGSGVPAISKPSPDDFELIIDTQEVDEHIDDGTARYLPGEFYYRRAVRRAHTSWDVNSLQALALAVVDEHQRLKEWVRRRLGYIPPKWCVHPDEAAEKNWELKP